MYTGTTKHIYLTKTHKLYSWKASQYTQFSSNSPYNSGNFVGFRHGNLLCISTDVAFSHLSHLYIHLKTGNDARHDDNEDRYTATSPRHQWQQHKVKAIAAVNDFYDVFNKLLKFFQLLISFSLSSVDSSF